MMTGSDFDERIDNPGAVDRLSTEFAPIHQSASMLWDLALSDRHLSSKLKELVLLALFASPAGYAADEVERQIDRALAAGAVEGDILDVFLSVAGIANHALYFALPIIERHYDASAIDAAQDPELRSRVAAMKEEFIRTRGFWNPDRDLLARHMPRYFEVLSQFSTTPARHGTLSPEERELIYIAIDASVNHMHAGGLDIHCRNAAKMGIPVEQIYAILQLVSAVGLFGYMRGSRHLLRT
jgi:alkylhydroperoxidase/carboxymuconolactone decarboxylase family protein YurZ